jgi:hypothetical protein
VLCSAQEIGMSLSNKLDPRPSHDPIFFWVYAKSWGAFQAKKNDLGYQSLINEILKKAV